MTEVERVAELALCALVVWVFWFDWRKTGGGR